MDATRKCDAWEFGASRGGDTIVSEVGTLLVIIHFFHYKGRERIKNFHRYFSKFDFRVSF